MKRLHELCTTHNTLTGSTRWYIDGKRVDWKKYNLVEIMAIHLECIHARTNGHLTRSWVTAWMKKGEQ